MSVYVLRLGCCSQHASLLFLSIAAAGERVQTCESAKSNILVISISSDRFNDVSLLTPSLIDSRPRRSTVASRHRHGNIADQGSWLLTATNHRHNHLSAPIHRERGRPEERAT